jgi:hypothetical protein
VKSMTLAEKLLQAFQKFLRISKGKPLNFVEFLRNKEQKELEDMMDAGYEFS